MNLLLVNVMSNTGTLKPLKKCFTSIIHIFVAEQNILTKNKNRTEQGEANAFGIRGCIQKLPDWPPGARTANDKSPMPLGAVVSLFYESV